MSKHEIPMTRWYWYWLVEQLRQRLIRKSLGGFEGKKNV